MALKLALGEKVDSFITSNDLVTHIKTNKATYETDLVIMCIGFRPNDTLYKGIETPNGV